MAIFDKLKFWKKEDSFAELNKQIESLKQQAPPQAPEGFGTPSHESLMQSMDTGIPYEHSAEESSANLGFGLEPAEEKPLFPKQAQSYAPLEHAPQQSQSSLQSQMEIIAAKLDTIRVSLESINHRLVAVERALHVQEYEEPIQPRRRRGVW
jgi:hypothetical protein